MVTGGKTLAFRTLHQRSGSGDGESPSKQKFNTEQVISAFWKVLLSCFIGFETTRVPGIQNSDRSRFSVAIGSPESQHLQLDGYRSHFYRVDMRYHSITLAGRYYLYGSVHLAMREQVPRGSIVSHQNSCPTAERVRRALACLSKQNFCLQ